MLLQSQPVVTKGNMGKTLSNQNNIYFIYKVIIYNNVDKEVVSIFKKPSLVYIFKNDTLKK